MNLFNLFKKTSTVSKTYINHISVTEEIEVKIGKPATYPTEIVNLLQELFSKKVKVYTAYLAWVQNTATNEPPHYIFAIDTDEEWDSLIEETVSAVKKCFSSDVFIDFMKIGKGGINDYFINKTTPFYKK